MSTKLEDFKKAKQTDKFPEVQTGNTVKIIQNIGGKKVLFEGMVIAKKHGKGMSGTVTVRKVVDKVGVEKIFPLHSPTIESVEITKKGRARKSKIYYIKDKTKRIARKKIK